MKQKIVLYLRTDSDAKDLVAGGSVSHTIGVVNGFVNAGYRVVCASSAMTLVMSQLSMDDFIPLYIPRWLSFFGNKGAALFSTFIFTFQAACLLRKYDIEFIYQRYTLFNCTGIILSWWYKKKLILEFNSSKVWTELHWSPHKKIKMMWLVRLCEKINISYAHSIIAVSKPIKQQLISSGVASERIVVNPNGVATDLFDPQQLKSERRKMRASLGLANKYVFGFIGTFSYWHGVEEIVQMIPRVVVLCPNVHFLLIGSGPLFFQVQRQVMKDDITRSVTTLVGTVPQHRAREYLAACDAFLSPTQPNPDRSPFFGSPTKLFEYMSLGKPIIASDLEQIAEVLQPAYRLQDILKECKENRIMHTTKELASAVGVLIPPRDVTGFVKAACWIFKKSISFHKRLGDNARAKACTHYTWNRHVNNIINASKEL